MRKLATALVLISLITLCGVMFTTFTGACDAVYAGQAPCHM